MPIKEYIVRKGFVVIITKENEDGTKSEKTFESGEVLKLDDDVAAQHMHKLELAREADRKAALAAEKAAEVAAKADSSPVELVQQLVAALAQAQSSAGVATTTGSGTATDPVPAS